MILFINFYVSDILQTNKQHIIIFYILIIGLHLIMSEYYSCSRESYIFKFFFLNYNLFSKYNI